MQGEQLAGFPVAGLMEQIRDEKLTKMPAAGLMAQIRDEQLTGTPVAGLMEQMQDEQVEGYLATGLAGTGAPSRAHQRIQSFSQCKMTPCPNPNLARRSWSLNYEFFP
jgi:hypothetical protein